MSVTLSVFLAEAVDRLQKASIDNPQLDARLLFCHALTYGRAQLLSKSERVLSAEEISAIEKLLARREIHESVARIIGHREFWGLEFGLNEATLEPRPDSETLIEAVLRKTSAAKRLLDLGTGTGCLLLSLLHEMPHATGLGIDIAPRAVEQAQENATNLGLDKRAVFRIGDWFEGITEKFDVIISNPPYIAGGDIPGLMAEVRDYDPLRALDGGADGFDIYRFLIPHVKEFLTPGGFIVFENGQNQATQVTDLLHQNKFTRIETHMDLGGVERCVTAYIS